MDTPIFSELAQQWAADGRTIPGHLEDGADATPAMEPVPPGGSSAPS